MNHIVPGSRPHPDRARRHFGLGLGLVLGLGLGLLSSACDPPTAQPSLRICSEPDCIETPSADDDDPCASLADIEPGAGFYAVHAVPSDVVLDDAAKGSLVIETGCGQKSIELTYETAQGEASERRAVVPILAPPDTKCGLTVRATLLDQSAQCVRPIDGSATECAKLRDACAQTSAGDEAETEADETEGTATGGDAMTTTGGNAMATTVATR